VIGPVCAVCGWYKGELGLLVENLLISLDDKFNPFIYRLQMTISDDYCNFDNLVLESI
jgi:hypothetical protein